MGLHIKKQPTVPAAVIPTATQPTPSVYAMTTSAINRNAQMMEKCVKNNKTTPALVLSLLSCSNLLPMTLDMEMSGPSSTLEVRPNASVRTEKSHEIPMNIRTVGMENFVGSANWEMREEKVDAPKMEMLIIMARYP